MSDNDENEGKNAVAGFILGIVLHLDKQIEALSARWSELTKELGELRAAQGVLADSELHLAEALNTNSEALGEILKQLRVNEHTVEDFESQDERKH